MFCWQWAAAVTRLVRACGFRLAATTLRRKYRLWWKRCLLQRPASGTHPRGRGSSLFNHTPIAVAMSGGVDSSVVAGLLQREGFHVVGLTMQLWNQRRLPELAPEGGAVGRCCSLDDVYDARAVAGELGIPYYVVNFEDRFEEQVVKPFVDDYRAGRTPIPCTLCNNFIKFDQFLAMADSVGAEKIATGHYARIDYDSETDRYQMRTGVDGTKDQTYFLFGLTQEQLSRTAFPLGGLVKSDVRRLAGELGLAVATKNDSQEICFVP